MLLNDFEMTAFSKGTKKLKNQYKLFNWSGNILSYVECPSVLEYFSSTSNNSISTVQEESACRISVPKFLRVFKIDIKDVLHVASKLCSSEIQFW
jgi:hypothetical protein